MWEVLEHLGLSEEGENRRAMSRLTNLKWFGDSQEAMEKWNHEALLACDGATRAGITNDTVVSRLRECLEESKRFGMALETWVENERRGGKMEWTELLSVFGDRLTTWRSRLAEAEADAQTGKGPKPAAATGDTGLPPPQPQGPLYDTSTHAGRVLTKFQNVCRN